MNMETENLILSAVESSVDAAYLRLKENGLNEITGRLDSVEGRLDSLEGRMENIEGGINDIKFHLGIEDTYNP